MNLRRKKELAARSLKVGKKRVSFVGARIDEIKEAITKQDIKDLHKEGAIILKETKGKKKTNKKKSKGPGSVRKKINTRKKDYVTMTRKLRGYVKELKKRGNISDDEVKDIRKKIRNRSFRSKSHLRDSLEK